MKRNRLPLVTLTIGLILILGSMGVAYGLWAEKLTVAGLVYTGEVNANWTSCICTDTPNGPDPQPMDFNYPNPYPYPAWEHKDVGKTSCTIDQEDPRIVHFTVENGYPSYWGNCELHYANTGTVPVIVRGYSVVPENFTLSSANGADDGEIWFNYWDSLGMQLEPCPAPDGYRCEAANSMQFHVEQKAQENYTYNFDVLVCVGQWNEDASIKECLEWAPEN